MTEQFIRQYDILQPSNFKIHIVGAGGIGSPTALVLAKMGYQDITVHDFDAVEEHNTASQFYRLDQLGKPKLEALKENILAFTGVEIKTAEGNVDRISNSDIIVMAVDNMKSRQEIYKNSLGYRFYVDGRMGGQVFNLYAFTPFNAFKYDKTLYSDEEAEEVPCTAKAIAYNTFGIASYIANLIKRFDRNESYPFEINGDYVNCKLYSSN